MKLLSSDYDGTLNALEYDLWFNLAFVKHFMARGNIFMLNTGRPYESISEEINKYGIPYNYLACTDGNLLLNSNNDLIYATNLQVDIEKMLWRLQEKFPSISLFPITYQGNLLEYQLVTSQISDQLLGELKRICAFYNLTYKTFHVLDKMYLYIGSKFISKSTAINKVKELEKIQDCDIFTVGDDMNDFEMIRDFNGYSLPWSKNALKKVGYGSCGSVGTLIKKISR